MRNNRKIKIVLAAMASILLVGAATFALLLIKEQKQKNTDLGQAVAAANAQTDESRGISARKSGTTLTYEGTEYAYNSDIRNILFLGVDKKDEMQALEYEGRGGQADCIILLSLNTKDKTASMLNISRDSMTDIDIYGINGDFLTTENAQLALQYAYGDGDKRSCWLMKKAVSDLLGDLPVHSYIAMNIDGISTINDVLGGVEITFPEDYTKIDSAFEKGQTLALTGSQAEKYVRYRDINELGSNNGRMVRQNQFLRALISLLKEKVASDSDYIDRLMSAGKPFMTTDMTADEIKALSEYRLDETFLKVPGEVRGGAEHDEFIVNYEELRGLLIKRFYK